MKAPVTSSPDIVDIKRLDHLLLVGAEVRRLYAFRAQIGEGIRACKDQLGLNGCQARSERARLHRMTCCLVAFWVQERERHERQVSLYQRKRRLSPKVNLWRSQLWNGCEALSNLYSWRKWSRRWWSRGCCAVIRRMGCSQCRR
jgi:hypothetical protein